MSETNQYIESGVLEMYVLGALDGQQRLEVEEKAAAHPEIKEKITELQRFFEDHAQENAVAPHPAIKPMVFAIMDYTERMEGGEKPSYPPVIHEHSKPEDYREWLERTDMQPPTSYEGIFAKLIGVSPEVTSAIVWIKHMAPPEIHDNEYEKFLIIEGTCDITVGEKVYKLKPGDNFTIPLHENHFVTVTSAIPCKVVLQRVAA